MCPWGRGESKGKGKGGEQIPENQEEVVRCFGGIFLVSDNMNVPEDLLPSLLSLPPLTSSRFSYLCETLTCIYVCILPLTSDAWSDAWSVTHCRISCARVIFVFFFGGGEMWDVYLVWEYMGEGPPF